MDKFIKNKMLQILLSFSLIVSVQSAVADQKITSYNTSSIGEYHRLRLLPRPTLVGPCDMGTFYIDDTLDQLQICTSLGWEGVEGVWQKSTWFDPAVGATVPVVFVAPSTPGNRVRVGINVRPAWPWSRPWSTPPHTAGKGYPRDELEVRGIWSDWRNYRSGNIEADNIRIGPNMNRYGLIEAEPDFGTGEVYAQFSARDDGTGNFIPVQIDGQEIYFSIENVDASVNPNPPVVPVNDRSVGIGVTAFPPYPATPLDPDTPSVLLYVRDNIQARENKAKKYPIVSGPPWTVFQPDIYGYMRGATAPNHVEFGSRNDDAGAYYSLNMHGYPVSMQTNSGGFVGIGVTGPQYPLDIAGRFEAEEFTLMPTIGGPQIFLKKAILNNRFELGAFNFPAPGYIRLEIDADPLIFNLNSGERVGISRTPTAASSYLFEVNGSVQATDYAFNSDERLKENIKVIDSPFEKLSQIKAVRYKWKDEEKGDSVQLGLIAQEVEKVFPDAVTTIDDGRKALSYYQLVGPLVEAVKELSAEHEELKARLNILEAELEAEMEAEAEEKAAVTVAPSENPAI